MSSSPDTIYEIREYIPPKIGSTDDQWGIMYYRVGTYFKGIGTVTSIEKNEYHLAKFGATAVQVFVDKGDGEEVLWTEFILPAPIKIIYNIKDNDL